VNNLLSLRRDKKDVESKGTECSYFMDGKEETYAGGALMGD
jgi:hypothetical protein